MKLNKIAAMAVASVLALSMVACGGSSSTAAPANSTANNEPASAQTIFALEDLQGKTVGVQLGTTGDIYMSGETGSVEDGCLNIAGVEQYNKAADAVQALLTNKIDAVCIDDQVAQKFVQANPDKLTILDTAYATEDYAACVSKENAELTAAMNAAIAELRADGTLEAILDKYINQTEGAVGYVTPEGTEYPNGTLTMATNAEFEPYEFKDGTGAIVGVDAEFAKAICDKLGYELVIDDMAFDSIIAAVQSGKADFGMAGMTVTEERLLSIDFTDSYCSGVQSIIVLK